MDWRGFSRITWFNYSLIMAYYFSAITKKQLAAIADSNCIAGAYIFSGNPGSFLGSAAEFFAAKILCLDSNSPCGHCKSCLEVKAGNSLHYRVFQHAKWSIETIRDLQRVVTYGADTPTGHLVVVLPNSEAMSTEAANAALKLLEEPPRGVCFILLTYHPQQLIPTIQSRCQTIEIPLGDLDNAIANLPEDKRELLHSVHNQPELMRYVLEFGEPLKVPYRPLSEVLSLDVLSRLLYIQELGTDKEDILLVLSAWLAEGLKASPKSDQQALSQLNHIVDTMQDMKYNVNTRLQLEQLMLQLS